jgi:hypothetical protein
MNDLVSTHQNVMLVEGLSDRHFVSHIKNRLVPSLSFDIEAKEGLSTLIQSIYGEVSLNTRQIVGILVDADNDPDKRWDEVSSRLSESGISVPSSPNSEGTIIYQKPSKPRVGIWIMPDNHSSGELEDFVIEMIPDHDAVWPRSVGYVDGIPIKERKFAPSKTARAKLYAWLATCERAPHIGAAIGDGVFDLQTDGCQAFVRWIERLFGTESHR